MLSDYMLSFRAVLKFEGGFSNDAHDPGGATNLGIIQKEYDAYRSHKGLDQQSVRQITQNEANEIYKIQYWDVLRLDDFPAGIDFAIFDAAVNNGVGAAPKFAQRACNKVSGSNLDVDGHLGLISRAAIFSCQPESFIDAFCDERLRFDRGLKIWRYFGLGWAKRVNGDPRTGYQGVRGIAKALALKARGITPPLAPPQLISHETIAQGVWAGVIQSVISWIEDKFRRKTNVVAIS